MTSRRAATPGLDTGFSTDGNVFTNGSSGVAAEEIVVRAGRRRWILCLRGGWRVGWRGPGDDVVEITQQIARDGIAGLGFEVEEVEPRQVGRCRQ